jgi:NAD(P)H-flavin reductase
MTTAVPATADAWRPRPFRVSDRRRETHDTVTIELESLDRRGLPFAPGQFTMVGPAGRRRRSDLDQRTPRPTAAIGAHDPRRRRGHEGALPGK